MKRWGLSIITVATILFTGCILNAAGWFGPRATASGSTVRTAPRESLSSASALHHGRCQPHHWRDCLLAH